MTRTAIYPIIAALCVLSGLGCLPISFHILTIPNIEPFQNALGWGLVYLGGTLVCFGMIYLVVLLRTPSTHTPTLHVYCVMRAFLPPACVYVFLPIAFEVFYLSVRLLHPFVMIGCIIWSVFLAHKASSHLIRLMAWKKWRLIYAIILTTQILLILSTRFYFDYALNRLAGMGMKIGWS